MSELEERLNSILNSPEEMSRIAQMAQSLMGAAPPAAAEPEAPAADAGLPDKLRALFSGGAQSAGKNDSLALIEAMEPFLGEKRRRKMSRALQIARAAKLAGKLFAEDGGEGDR